jgi:hypothetical protein
LKIYLDTCCLSRLDDIATSVRIQREAEAVETILNYCSTRQWLWFGSEVLVLEVDNTPDPSKRFNVKLRLSHLYQTVIVGSIENSRGLQLEILGFKWFDALHLACAESANVDVFLTTDDGILKRAERFSSQLHVRVANPYEWLQEIIRDENP